MSEWIAEVLRVLYELMAGAITHDEAKARLAALAAADAAADAAEREKLG
jgi:hypothetical protein